MKRFALRILTAFLLVALASSASAQTVINVWMGSWWEAQIPVVKAAFEAEFPQYDLRIEPRPINGYLDAATTAILGGSPPDVLALDAIMISSLAGRNFLAPWNDYITDLDVSDFASGIWNAGLFGSDVFAIPYRGSTVIYYYNKAMFDDAGVAYPTEDWTYADMLEMAKQITVPGERYGLGIAASPSDPANVTAGFAPLVWAFGGDFLNEDNTEFVLNQPEGVAAIEFWADLYKTHQVVPEGTLNYATSRDLVPLFTSNGVAMIISASQNIAQFDAIEGFEYGIVNPPERVSVGGGWSFTIPYNARNPDAGRDFVLWFTQPDVLSRLTIREPARISATSSAPWDSEAFGQVFRYSANTKILPPVPAWGEIQAILITELQLVMQGSKTAQQAADDMHAQVTPLLGR
jgi:multiple sugar transport system substrate-binding protein